MTRVRAEAHLRALFDAVGAGGVTHILLTHHHADHAGAAEALAAKTGARLLDSRSLRDGEIGSANHSAQMLDRQPRPS